MKYTESQLEKSFIHLLKEEGYEYVNCKDVVRASHQEVLIREDLSDFLLSRYPDLETIELETLINELAYQPASNLYDSNKYIGKLLADGLIFKRNNPSKKDLHIRYIDIDNGWRFRYFVRCFVT